MNSTEFLLELVLVILFGVIFFTIVRLDLLTKTPRWENILILIMVVVFLCSSLFLKSHAQVLENAIHFTEIILSILWCVRHKDMVKRAFTFRRPPKDSLS